MALYEHILLPEQVRISTDYSPRSRGGAGKEPPIRNRQEHSQQLLSLFSNVQQENDNTKQVMLDHSLPARDGLYIEFAGKPECELDSEKLEDSRADIQLLNTRQVKTDDGDILLSTIFIPHGKENAFVNKISKYASEDTQHGRPRYDKIIRQIEHFRMAHLESLWTGNSTKFPSDNNDWYEVWIRTKNTDIEDIHDVFRNTVSSLGIEYDQNITLTFPERSVFLVKANKNSLLLLLQASDLLAEIRDISPLASFFTGQRSHEQQEWVDDLINRVNFDRSSNSVISVIDSGVNNGHPLLSDLIPDENCDYVVDTDHTDRKGHGTQMCGVALYGDLISKLETTNAVNLDYQLFSVKIFGQDENEKSIWGELTNQCVQRTKIALPNKKPCYCLAVTSVEECEDGKPSSWSAEIDAISQYEQELFMISAGNIEDYNGVDKDIIMMYPNGNKLRTILDPAQSWNALTIGAYTELIGINNPNLRSFDRVAPSGGISPFARTSALWSKSAIIKPEVVFEGGNLLKTGDAQFPFSLDDDLSMLTTNHQYRSSNIFDSINATSCATALASNFAGRLQAHYPNLWAESIRGLMVHSAKWSEEMERQFPVNNQSRSDMAVRMRHCGYGIPTDARAFHSTENGFTFIAQEEIQPYVKEGGSVKINEMHLYELPWPKEILAELGDVDVTLRITLSYFIEPSPGEIGWGNKYSYSSHGLRFDINNTNESKEDFEGRINRLAHSDDSERSQNDSKRWAIGSDNRDKGSIHSDFITTSAVNLTECNVVGVYPIGGWWKNRLTMQRFNNKVRYSLIVSLDTPELDIDIYNTVKAKIENIVATRVEVEIATV